MDSLIDLRSDTVTRPTPAMREAMAKAEVGDDVMNEDPTVHALQAKTAAVLGKEAALFVPSGTMANLIAILAQCPPGETVILGQDAHPYRFEAGGGAFVGGVMMRPLAGANGILDPEDVAHCVVRTEDTHASETALIAIENTTNFGGGNVYPLETIKRIRAIADKNGVRVHCDGARLFNAVVASGISAADFARDVDTVSVCFSKGLGAPVGSAVVGSRAFIDRARKLRKMLGGGMRQAGVIAAAALYALEHHVERLREDHRKAAAVRGALEGMPGISFPMPTPTNIVFADVPDVMRFVGEVGGRGVLILPVGPKRVRAVFHLDVHDNDVDRIIEAFKAGLRPA